MFLKTVPVILFVGAAAFVRDWKPVSAEAEFAAPDQTDADRASADDNDGAVRTTMGTKTGSQSVADKANGRERMRNLRERRLGASAPETRKTDRRRESEPCPKSPRAK
jgi:hypothetical protein